MYCGGCGAPNPEGNNFCKQCGRRSFNRKTSEPQIAGSKDMDPPAEVRSMPHPATIIIAICSFLVIIFWFFSSRKTKLQQKRSKHGG